MVVTRYVVTYSCCCSAIKHCCQLVHAFLYARRCIEGRWLTKTVISTGLSGPCWQVPLRNHDVMMGFFSRPLINGRAIVIRCRLSVCLWRHSTGAYCGKTSKRRIMQSSLKYSSTLLVSAQWVWRWNSKGFPLFGGIKCEWGVHIWAILLPHWNCSYS